MANILFDGWTWSFSRLRLFEQCPWAFAQRYLYGVPSETNFYAAYGSLVHEIHEQWYKGKLPKDQVIPSFVSGFVRLPGTEPERRSKYLLEGLDYFGKDIYTPGHIVGIERRVRFHAGPYRFQGIIDLLYEEDGGLTIMDHKSHDLRPRSGKQKPTAGDRELDEYLRQLYLYAHAVRELNLGEVKKLVFNCFRTGTRVEEPFSAAGEAEAVTWAEDTIRKIENSVSFLPSPDWFYCRSLCDTRAVCDYKE